MATSSRRTPPSPLVKESDFAVYESNRSGLSTIENSEGLADSSDSAIAPLQSNPKSSGWNSEPSSSTAISDYTSTDSNVVRKRRAAHGQLKPSHYQE